MTIEEIAAVLAGLRSLQADILAGVEPIGIDGDSLMDILTNCGDHPPISATQIDELCIRINTTPQEEW